MSNFDIQLPIKRLDPTVELPRTPIQERRWIRFHAEDVDLALLLSAKLISTGLAFTSQFLMDMQDLLFPAVPALKRAFYYKYPGPDAHYRGELLRFVPLT